VGGKKSRGGEGKYGCKRMLKKPWARGVQPRNFSGRLGKFEGVKKKDNKSFQIFNTGVGGGRMVGKNVVTKSDLCCVL